MTKLLYRNKKVWPNVAKLLLSIYTAAMRVGSDFEPDIDRRALVLNRLAIAEDKVKDPKVAESVEAFGAFRKYALVLREGWEDTKDRRNLRALREIYEYATGRHSRFDEPVHTPRNLRLLEREFPQLAPQFRRKTF